MHQTLAGPPPSMDTVTALTTHINLQTLPVSSPTLSSLNSNTATKQHQPYFTNTHAGDIHVTTSIYELRSFSTALSAFLSRYDELHDHISFINSSIDDVTVSVRNPSASGITRDSEAISDRAVDVVPEGGVSEQNPRERVSDCERRHAVTRTPENTNFPCGYDEIVASKTSEVADVLKNTEEVDNFENSVEIGALKKPEAADLLNNSEETDVETVPETSCDEKVAVVPEAVVSEQKPNGMVANDKQSLGEIDVLVPMKIEKTDILIKHEQIEICKCPEETIISKQHEDFDTLMIPEELVVLKKLEETVLQTSCDRTIAIVSKHNLDRMALRTPESLEKADVLNKVEEIDVCKNPEQSDVLQKHEETGELNKPEGLDTLIVSEELDISVIPEVFDTPTKPEESLTETSCGEAITTVPEAIVLKQNPNQMVSNDEEGHEIACTPENVEEIDVLKKHEQTDFCKNPEESALSKEPEELDILNLLEEIDTSKRPEESLPETSLNDVSLSKKPEETTVVKKPEKINTLKKHAENRTCTKAKEPEALKNSMLSKLETLCQSMNSKGLKWHISTHYSEMVNLREEIANALKLAEDPAKLVLNSIGQFFVQGINTFRKPNRVTQNLARMAAVLILECFLMISSDDGIEIAKEDHNIAAKAAVCWRNRMITEGGPGHTDETDARGLLLLISGFGIQDEVFKIQDIMDLIRASNVKVISTALCRSVFLIPKIPEVIDLMVKNNLKVEAADIAYAFGLEDKCHPQSIHDIRNIKDGSSFQTSHENVRTPECLEETVVSNKPEQTKEIDTSNMHEEISTCMRAKEPEASKNSMVSKLEHLCQGMCSKDVKWHVAAHFSQMINLREDIAKALKLAKDPAKLVLDSTGRFFIQGSRQFRNPANPHLNKESLGRMAAILILECFVMISSDDGIEIAKTDQDRAAKAAVCWRNRMIREGGPGHTDEFDARGLLLLISGFGIQDDVFSIQDIIDLIRASNVKEISTALRRSVFLVPKIPEVVHLMVKNNMEIEAADIAYAFGLEDKCHPQNILALFLHNKIREIQNGSFQMLEEKKQHLIDLKSVQQCLESHKIDPSMLLSDFKINERIKNLEKEINEWRLIQKRKSLEKPIHKEAKRACVSQQNMLPQQNPVDHYGMSRFIRSTRSSTRYFDPGQSPGNSYITNCSTSSIHNAPSMPENLADGLASGFHGHDQMVHGIYGRFGPYVAPYSSHGQPYNPQSHGGQLESFQGVPALGSYTGKRGPSSELYGFVDIVEKELCGLRHK